MLIMHIIKKEQPGIYAKIIRNFTLGDIEPQEREPIRYVKQPEFPEDDYDFAKYKGIMQQRKAVEI